MRGGVPRVRGRGSRGRSRVGVGVGRPRPRRFEKRRHGGAASGTGGSARGDRSRARRRVARRSTRDAATARSRRARDAPQYQSVIHVQRTEADALPASNLHRHPAHGRAILGFARRVRQEVRQDLASALQGRANLLQLHVRQAALGVELPHRAQQRQGLQRRRHPSTDRGRVAATRVEDVNRTGRAREGKNTRGARRVPASRRNRTETESSKKYEMKSTVILVRRFGKFEEEMAQTESFPRP